MQRISNGNASQEQARKEFSDSIKRKKENQQPIRARKEKSPEFSHFIKRGKEKYQVKTK